MERSSAVWASCLTYKGTSNPRDCRESILPGLSLINFLLSSNISFITQLEVLFLCSVVRHTDSPDFSLDGDSLDAITACGEL